MKKFSAVIQVRKESRALIGTVRGTTYVPHKNKRAPKHKQTLAKLLDN